MSRLTKLSLFSIAAAVLAFAAPAHAAATVYEPFAYPANAFLNGKNGGTGFNGAWFESGI